MIAREINFAIFKHPARVQCIVYQRQFYLPYSYHINFANFVFYYPS